MMILSIIDMQIITFLTEFVVMEIDFWNIHGIGFLICAAIFPRLTLLFATIWGGLLWWLGLIFLPRLTIAILAIPFFDSNPILVIIAWVVVLSGETVEKKQLSDD